MYKFRVGVTSGDDEYRTSHKRQRHHANRPMGTTTYSHTHNNTIKQLQVTEQGQYD